MNVQLGISTVKGLEALLRDVDPDEVGIITGNETSRNNVFEALEKLGFSDGVFSSIAVLNMKNAKDAKKDFWNKNLIVYNPNQVIETMLTKYKEDATISGMFINIGSANIAGIEVNEAEKAEKSGTVYKANLEHNLCIMKDHNIFEFCGMQMPEGIKTGEEVITKIDLKVTAVFGDNGCLADNLEAKLLMPDCVFEPIVIKNEEDGVVDIVNGYMDKNYVVHFSNCSRTAFCVHIVGEICTEPAR